MRGFRNYHNSGIQISEKKYDHYKQSNKRDREVNLYSMSSGGVLQLMVVDTLILLFCLLSNKNIVGAI